ncbi:hypothetical protein EUTSA_v10001101mg [Eutrema salsugineum]|uniref:HMA domain-containing protein n=1 Tax=Eutrema salsugineum TaxID=72664 RepID=V4L7H5_EUTSA|nr:heavy metal-associated isoprenylated plant protein 42 [Eutrema salsugineum]ESQ39589.1 hypothetical protein EUTSA_v10001101mg [Eutrema salsugineum]
MEDLDFPICILKMNLQCCQDFPCLVKKRLREVKGVYAITIDPAKGLILVSGTAEPPLLIKAIEKIGQSPPLYAYEKEPTKAKTQFKALLKRYATEERQDELPPTADDAGACPGKSGPPPTADAGACPAPISGFGYSGQPMMPIFTLPQTMGPPGWLAPGTKPRLMVRYEEPEMKTRKAPAPYPFDFYESKGFPASDSLFKYFSDDHAQPCTIM